MVKQLAHFLTCRDFMLFQNVVLGTLPQKTPLIFEVKLWLLFTTQLQLLISSMICCILVPIKIKTLLAKCEKGKWFTFSN